MGGSSSSNRSSQNTSNTSTSYGLSNSTGLFGSGNKIENHEYRNDGTLAGANVTGNIQITDGGAFDLVGQGVGATLNTVNDVANGAFLLADGVTGNALSAMESTAYSAIDRTSYVANNAIAEGNSLARDLAAENSLLARESVQFGGALYRDLLDTTSKLSSEKDNFAIDTTKMALQFADNASRSDGQQLAIEQGKNMVWIVLGIAAVGGVLMLKK